MPAREKFDILEMTVNDVFDDCYRDFVLYDTLRHALFIEIENKLLNDAGKYYASLFFSIDAICTDSLCSYGITDVNVSLRMPDKKNTYDVVVSSKN